MAVLSGYPLRCDDLYQGPGERTYFMDCDRKEGSSSYLDACGTAVCSQRAFNWAGQSGWLVIWRKRINFHVPYLWKSKSSLDTRN